MSKPRHHSHHFPLKLPAHSPAWEKTSRLLGCGARNRSGSGHSASGSPCDADPAGRGDPSVSIGIYATALWMMGRANALGELADPEKDLGHGS